MDSLLCLCVALMALVDNLPLNFASKPGFQNFMTQLLGDKRVQLPTEDTLAKSVLMLQESVLLTTKMLVTRAKSVCSVFACPSSRMYSSHPPVSFFRLPSRSSLGAIRLLQAVIWPSSCTSASTSASTPSYWALYQWTRPRASTL